MRTGSQVLAAFGTLMDDRLPPKLACAQCSYLSIVLFNYNHAAAKISNSKVF